MSYWCAASSGRWGCISGHQTGSCRCWGCTLWPPGWACSCAPVRYVSRRHKVCLETSPHLHCRLETKVTTTCFKGRRQAAEWQQKQWCQQQQDLQLIDEDVRHPHVRRRYRNLFDFVKVFWVPDQEFIRPRLKYSTKGEAKWVKNHVNMIINRYLMFV